MSPCVRVAIASAGAFLFLVPLAMADDGIAGRWTGVVEQSDGQSYEAVMELDNTGQGRSDYPSLDCTGKLSGTGSNGVYQFRETIVTGRAGEKSGHCVDGSISLSVSGSVMDWSWSGSAQGQAITARATLARER